MVPRIILIEQFKNELIYHKPELRNDIQLIGDGNNEFDENKNITICVFNSIGLLEDYFDTFYKIFVNKAHHIRKPFIYSSEAFDEINTETKDDSEDEIKDTMYINIIRKLTKYDNNVYFSATIDENDGFRYYSKDVRDMIDNKYLCDYVIKIPIFKDEPTNKNICQYLLRNCGNVIIYCNTQKEGKKFNKLMNELQKKNSSKYVDFLKLQRNHICLFLPLIYTVEQYMSNTLT